MSTSLISTWVFDSLLVTSLLMAAILLIRRPVAQIFGPGVAYALWLIPAVRLLMPSISVPHIAPASESSQAVRDAVRESILAGVPSSEPVVSAAGELSAASSIDYTTLGLTVWLGGAALFFIIQMIRYASMRDDLLSEAEEIAVIDRVKVVASDQVAGPLAFGLFKRYIAVPQDFAKAYSLAERELAIAHEMAHHKSGDLFANLAAFIVLCLQWFNPLAWLSWSAFRFDQEAACDARVLAGKCAEERAIYGQALARTAFDGVPTFATALNSPKTIIERLRRLTMKDASKQRRSLGKLGIFAAAAVILPLTATIVPAVTAHDETVAEDSKPETIRSNVRVIKLKRDGKTVDIVGHDGKGGEVTKVERDGKTFIFRTDKKLSEEEVEQWIENAEKSREEAEESLAEAEEARIEAEAERGVAESAREATEEAKDAAERGRTEAIRVMSNMNFASYIPEIDIKEITRNCKNGEPVTTNVSGFDGQHRSRVRIVMCGKGQAKVARLEALKGLREARGEIADDSDIPEGIRKDVMDKLEEQIRKLEAEADKAG
jgi:beta-lactamase regulating signal transducer with metallopeptidase domain